MRTTNYPKLFAVPQVTAPPAEPPVSEPAKRRWIGKKLYAAIAVAAIVIISVAFFIPQGGATIPLKVDYVVGEKMVYDSTLSIELDAFNTSLGGLTSSIKPTDTTMHSKQTIEVTGFDGENYLLNHITTMTVLNRSISVSMTEKMNKTGYSTYLLNLGDVQTEIPNSGFASNSYLAQLLNKPEAKVGDTVSIPYPSTGSSSIQVTGDLTAKFNGVEDLTVPAGTYRVFRIDITSNDLKMTMNLPQGSPGLVGNGLSMDIGFNCQVYLEYGSMRQIKSTMEITSGYQSSMLNMASTMSMDMVLQEHTKP